MIDLRSDTVTKPTDAMRRAMAAAEVGDDVFGDDPTVIALQERVASLLGKEAALFVPSGTMSNQIAIRCHTQPGDDVLLDAECHIYNYESAAPAAISGVQCRTIAGDRGVFTATAVEAMLRPSNVHFAPTRLLCIESTHNRGGGKVWPMARIAEVTSFARSRGIATHLDGARLWNAAVATGIAEREWAGHFDTVSVCFSKGLGAPVGSALAGPADLIHRARRVRKMLGGGMRQAGIIAAGALYAVDHHRVRLAEDHAHAAAFARGIAGIDGIAIDPAEVETNIVFWDTPPGRAPRIADALHARGVWVLAETASRIRALTSLMVTGEQIEEAVQIVGEVMGGVGAR